MDLIFSVHRQSRATVEANNKTRYDYVYLTTIPLSAPFGVIKTFFEWLRLKQPFEVETVTYLEDDVSNKYTLNFSTPDDVALERDYTDINYSDIEREVYNHRKQQSSPVPEAPRPSARKTVPEDIQSKIKELMLLLGNRDFVCAYSGDRVSIRGNDCEIILAQINGSIGAKTVRFTVIRDTLVYVSEDKAVDMAFKDKIQCVMIK